MLAREVVIACVEQDALLAGGIIDDTGAELGAVRATHDERTNRVGAVVDAEGEHGAVKETGWGRGRRDGVTRRGTGFILAGPRQKFAAHLRWQAGIPRCDRRVAVVS